MKQTLIQGRDIVVVGLQAWDVDIGSNCKNIAEEFAKNNRVLYVNYPLDWITLLRERNLPRTGSFLRKIRGRENNLVQAAENIFNLFPDTVLQSINWIKQPGVFDALNRVNNRKYAGAIQRAITLLGMRDFILFNDNDIFRPFYMKELLHPALSVYYSRDNLVGVEYWKLHGERLEPKLIQKSDVCVANSTYLADYCGKYNKDSYYVGQGCELELFDETKVGSLPDDIQRIPSPRIGYVGALNGLRLDIRCLEHIAARMPAWNIVLVGPEDEQFKASALHSMPNVFFTGRKDGSELPAYIKGFDVCLNPQAVNEVTIGNYPRKIDEYLAMGKPVVATKTDAMSVFTGHAYLAGNPDDYAALISKAMEENTPQLAENRKMFAREHTWERSVEEIYKAMYEKTQS